MAMDFPNAPAEGAVYAPAGGPTYIYQSGIWVAQAIPYATVPTARSRNRIVNPAMQISQENGNTAVTLNGYYPADQWYLLMATTGAVSAQRVQSITPNGSQDRFRITVTTADTSITTTETLRFGTPLEGIKVSDFRWGTAAAKQVVLRFGWKSPAGTYSIRIANNAGTRTYLANFTIAAGQANTDTEQVLVIPGDTTASVWEAGSNVGLFLNFVMAVGPTYQGVVGWNSTNPYMGTAANTNGMATVGNVFELFDVGLYLDPDNTGLPPRFEVPDYADELLACQRYYEKADFTVYSAISAGQFPGGYWKATKRLTSYTVTNVPSAGTGAVLAALGPTAFYQTTAHSTPTSVTVIGNARM